jgi:hypothetical protein
MPDPADTSSILTAIADWAGDGDPHDPDPRPYADLLPPIRTALAWLTAGQPAGCAWPTDGIVYPRAGGPDVTLRVMIGTGAEGPYAAIMFERCGAGSPVARITRAVADRLHATVTALTPVAGTRAAIYMPGDTYTWWAAGLATAVPGVCLAAAYELTESGIYRSIHEPGYRDRVARLTLPPGWRADHGREYR